MAIDTLLASAARDCPAIAFAFKLSSDSCAEIVNSSSQISLKVDPDEALVS